MEASLEAMKESIDARKAEAERENRRQARMEKEIQELKSAMEQKSLEIKQKSLQIQSSEEQQVGGAAPLGARPWTLSAVDAPWSHTVYAPLDMQLRWACVCRRISGGS
jgi:hypothetical protein